MGGFFSRLVEKIRGMKEVRLLMLGLDNAGKTSKTFVHGHGLLPPPLPNTYLECPFR